jgi:hypothetical protein
VVGNQVPDIELMTAVVLTYSPLTLNDGPGRLHSLGEPVEADVVITLWQFWSERSMPQGEATHMLGVLDRDDHDPLQRDLVVPRDDELAPPGVRDRVWELLESALD